MQIHWMSTAGKNTVHKYNKKKSLKNIVRDIRLMKNCAVTSGGMAISEQYVLRNWNINVEVKGLYKVHYSPSIYPTNTVNTDTKHDSLHRNILSTYC